MLSADPVLDTWGRATLSVRDREHMRVIGPWLEEVAAPADMTYADDVARIRSIATPKEAAATATKTRPLQGFWDKFSKLTSRKGNKTI